MEEPRCGGGLLFYRAGLIRLQLSRELKVVEEKAMLLYGRVF